MTVQPRHMFQDGVCHICAKLDKGLLDIKPSPEVEEKSQVEAQREQEELLRLQAEAERVRKEREVEFNLQQEAARELARREAARRNLLPFVMYFNEAYTPGWVHADICRRLEQFSRDVADRKSPRLMLFMPPRSGKQLADSTPVLTTDGWKTHGELRVGDYVFHPSGKPVRVLAVSEKTPSDYVVTFSNGDNIRCHGNHEWTVSHDRKPMATHPTIWLKDRLTRSESSGKKTRYITRLPDIRPVERPRVDLTMHPYVLGLWLGDGSSTKAAITHDKKDQPMIDKVVSCGHVISSVCVHSDTGVVTTYFDGDRKANAGYKDGRCGKMLRQIRELGLERNKHIPEAYHLGSAEQRLELLAGLIDSDGCCDKNGRITFSTTNEKLKDGVMRLATELGFRPYFYKSEPKLSSSGIQGNLPVYIVGFNPNLELPQVIERKKSKRLAVRRLITIRNIEYAPNGEQGNCIQVDSPDGLYLAGRTLIPTHNSEIASKTFPAWHLGHHPSHDIIGCSYSAALAIDFSRKVRGLVQDERYHNIFPTRMDEASQSAERWNTAQGGGYVAAGVQGPITGRGAHCAVIDDVLRDREAAESEVTRQAIKDWYSSTLYTRLAPGGGVIVIMTRWHEDDLGGWLLECMKEAEQELAETGEWPEDADRWEVVKYPAIATHDEEYRKAGEALHPERYDIKALNKIKRTLIPRDWEALYQQNPVSADGDYFKKEHFRLYDTAPDISTLRVYAAWDLAIGKKDSNDFTCGVVVGIDRSNDIWVLHRYYGRWSADKLIQKFFECQDTWSPALQGIEHGQIEMTLEPFILKEMNEKKKKFSYIKLKTRGNDKMTRARPIQGRMEQGRVHFPRQAPWFQEMQNEMLAFPTGKHDDQVDALAWIGQMILMLAPEREKRPPAKRGWRDRLRKQLKGTPSGVSHMAS